MSNLFMHVSELIISVDFLLLQFINRNYRVLMSVCVSVCLGVCLCVPVYMITQKIMVQST